MPHSPAPGPSGSGRGCWCLGSYDGLSLTHKCEIKSVPYGVSFALTCKQMYWESILAFSHTKLKTTKVGSRKCLS